MSAVSETPQVSVVIPVRNEEEDVRELARRIGESLELPHEIIFVDDGSTDRTWQRLLELQQPGRIRLIRFRRNFGKAAALMAGFEASRGEIVFTMDGDLQDDPSEMPRFLDKLNEGYELVSGWKKTRHDPLSKVIASRLFNFVVRKLSRLELHDMNCGFKAYRGRLARELRIYGELHRFIPLVAAERGYRVGEIEVRHHPRRHGRSKYGFSRLFKGFFDLVTTVLTTRYGARPGHGFGCAALASFGLSAAFVVAYLLLPNYLFEVGDKFFPAWHALGLVAVFFALSGMTALAAGWVAETVVAAGLRQSPERLYAVEERLD